MWHFFFVQWYDVSKCAFKVVIIIIIIIVATAVLDY